MISHDKRFAERSVKRLWNMLQCGMDWHSPLNFAFHDQDILGVRVQLSKCW